MLQELRQLAQAHPEDSAVRDRLTKGLLITSVDAMEAGQTEKTNVLLRELQELAGRFPDDPTLQAIIKVIEQIRRPDRPQPGP